MFREIEYKHGDPITRVFGEFESARGQLEEADEHSKVSDDIMGYFLLETIGFTEAEEAHIF